MNCTYTVNDKKVAVGLHLCHNIENVRSIFRILVVFKQEEIVKHV